MSSKELVILELAATFLFVRVARVVGEAEQLPKINWFQSGLLAAADY